MLFFDKLGIAIIICIAIIECLDNPPTTKPLKNSKKSKSNIGSETKVVYIIRHGEKIWVPWNKTAYLYACLSQQGYSRAYNLLSVFSATSALFSFNYDDGDLDCRTSQGYYRAQATLAPLGDALDLQINNSTGSKPDLCGPQFGTPIDTCSMPTANESVHDYGPCCNIAAAEAIKSVLMEDDIDSILCAWEHTNIKYLANALGANNCQFPNTTNHPVTGCNMTWPDEFDKIFALYFNASNGDFLKIDTNLEQGFKWIGPTIQGTEDYNFGPGEIPDLD